MMGEPLQLEDPRPRKTGPSCDTVRAARAASGIRVLLVVSEWTRVQEARADQIHRCGAERSNDEMA